jgi:hypothetical protein
MRKRAGATLEEVIGKQAERQSELAGQRADYQEPTEREENPNGLSDQRKQELIKATALQETFMAGSSLSASSSSTPASVVFTPQAVSQVTRVVSESCCKKAMQMCTLL